MVRLAQVQCNQLGVCTYVLCNQLSQPSAQPLRHVTLRQPRLALQPLLVWSLKVAVPSPACSGWVCHCSQGLMRTEVKRTALLQKQRVLQVKGLTHTSAKRTTLRRKQRVQVPGGLCE